MHIGRIKLGEPSKGRSDQRRFGVLVLCSEVPLPGRWWIIWATANSSVLFVLHLTDTKSATMVSYSIHIDHALWRLAMWRQRADIVTPDRAEWPDPSLVC